ncbi:hypothetical protein ERX27_07525 [Macrococcus brunensis]|uniref:Uncharacterized protein n=1 Tax=Macrococcus brunensis TaxID=198483 RepID=A0A4R6BCW8_9STAP|nr:hypothetical protein [Macrococcus brunensis]TDL96696.1 hypothetical protein ERX27_07525 [Macrococcus brunensis]
MNTETVSYMDGMNWESVDAHYKWLGERLKKKRMKPSEYRQVLNQSIKGLMTLSDDSVSAREYYENRDLASNLGKSIGLSVFLEGITGRIVIYKLEDIQKYKVLDESVLPDNKYYRDTYRTLVRLVEWLNKYVDVFEYQNGDE